MPARGNGRSDTVRYRTVTLKSNPTISTEAFTLTVRYRTSNASEIELNSAKLPHGAVRYLTLPQTH